MVKDYIKKYEEITIIGMGWRFEFKTSIYRHDRVLRRYVSEHINKEVKKAIEIGKPNGKVYLYV